MPGLRDRLTDAGYGLGWSVVCRLPESWARRAFRLGADVAWWRRGPGVQVLEGNLRRVIGSQPPGGQLRGLSRQVMRSYARYWLEAFRLPVMPADRVAAGVHDTGHLRAALEYLAAGRGVIFALPHMGNYELAGVLGDADRRGLTPLFHANMTPYGEVQLRMDRRLHLTAAPQADAGEARQASGSPA